MQRCSSGFEIIVGLDGDAGVTPQPAVPASLAGITRVIRMGRLGLVGVRREMHNHAQGELVLWLNDDSYAAQGLLETHLQMHEHRVPRVVAGQAKWKPVQQPSLFDEIVQRTDLLFFQQDAAVGPMQTNYRNCFGLNLSFPRELLDRAGGIPETPESYGYEDIELAYRLEHAGAELWHAPDALVVHDHRYAPLDVHRREYLLGRAAWHFAGLNPSFAYDLFRREIRSETEISYIKEALVHERRDAIRVEQAFIALNEHPADAVANELLPLLAQHWIVLKRYLWRQGVIDASIGVPPRWSLLRDDPKT